MKNNGATLPEVLIVLGLMSVTALAIATMSSNMMHSVVTAEDSQEVTSLGYEVNGILNNSNLCTDRFTTHPVHSQNGAEVILAPNIKANSNYRTLTINSVQLQNVTAIPSTSAYRADVRVRGTKRKGTMGTPEFMVSGGLFYNVAGGFVSECLGTDKAATLCASLGGTYTSVNGCNLCLPLGGHIEPDGSCAFPPQCLQAGEVVSPVPTPSPVPVPVPTPMPSACLATCYSGCAAQCTGYGSVPGAPPGFTCTPQGCADLCTAACAGAPPPSPPTTPPSPTPGPPPPATIPASSCCSGSAHISGSNYVCS